MSDSTTAPPSLAERLEPHHIGALERAIADFEALSNKLLDDLDYRAEIPGSDARALREVITFVKNSAAELERLRGEVKMLVAALRSSCDEGRGDPEYPVCSRAIDAELEIDALRKRLNWAANELLACDYGDNHDPRKIVGWCVYGWRSDTHVTEHFKKRRIYGSSIDEAIDAAIDAARAEGEG